MRLSGLTVAAPGQGVASGLDYAIHADGGSPLTRTGVALTDVRDEPFSGMQTGVAVKVEGGSAAGRRPP